MYNQYTIKTEREYLATTLLLRNALDTVMLTVYCSFRVS